MAQSMSYYLILFVYKQYRNWNHNLIWIIVALDEKCDTQIVQQHPIIKTFDHKSDAIYCASSSSNVEQFLDSLKNDTNVGEMGNRLSGEQKQRIAVARAMVSNPSI
eukprot:183103_1